MNIKRRESSFLQMNSPRLMQRSSSNCIIEFFNKSLFSGGFFEEPASLQTAGRSVQSVREHHRVSSTFHHSVSKDRAELLVLNVFVNAPRNALKKKSLQLMSRKLMSCWGNISALEEVKFEFGDRKTQLWNAEGRIQARLTKFGCCYHCKTGPIIIMSQSYWCRV